MESSTPPTGGDWASTAVPSSLYLSVYSRTLSIAEGIDKAWPCIIAQIIRYHAHGMGGMLKISPMTTYHLSGVGVSFKAEYF